MKFVTFEAAGHAEAPGILIDDQVHSLAAAGYADMLAIIEGGEVAMRRIEEALASAKRFPLAEVTLLAPIRNSARIFGIGLNYLDHAAEAKMQVQKVPTVFLKLTSSVVGPDAEVVLPKNATQVDYEAELAVVIGKGGYRITAGQWRDHVFGYTILNDVSARDIQLATTQWNLGKSFPTFTPLGPSITTADEIPDPHVLDISLTIDGETLQNANTRDLIFDIPALIEYLSSIVPLLPGDIISTGTPPGVGLGRSPQRWLKAGEEMVIEIEKLGALRNRTVSEA